MEKLFADLGLSAEVQKAVSEMGFEKSTPIQSQSIPVLLEGLDLVAKAPTGTGKTCAFGIPAIERIDPRGNHVQVLILCPTRELAVQSTNELTKLAKYKKGVRILSIYGGQDIRRQIIGLKNKPQILIATPGRLMDHMERKTVRLEGLEMLILDEADEMLNMGFREDLDVILKTVPEERQTILFSATVSADIMRITKSYQKDATVIEVAPKEVTVSTITQHYMEVKSPRKLETLCRLLDVNNFRQTMVFCNTKRMVDELCEGLCQRGYKAEALHGDMKQQQRDKVMASFKGNRAELLIATDVAARGIDVEDISCVVNYDLPTEPEYYVHRIGRTGRANRKGAAYSFVNPKDMYRLRQIMAFTKTQIMMIKAPTQDQVDDAKNVRIFEEINGVIASGGHARYLKLVEQYQDKYEETEMNDICAALMCRLLEKRAPKVGKMVEATPVRIKHDDFASNTPRHEVKKDNNWEEEFKPFGKAVKGKKIPTFPTFDDNFSEDIFKEGEALEAKAAEKRVRKESPIPSTENKSAENTVRLFLNIGRKDEIYKKELSELLCDALNVAPNKITDIEVLEKFSFVTLPSHLANAAIDALQGVEVDQRKISIEVASQKGTAPKRENSFDARKPRSAFGGSKKPPYKGSNGSSSSNRDGGRFTREGTGKPPREGKSYIPRKSK